MEWSAIWSRISSPKIVIFADFIDPFCYIGFHNVRRVAEAKKIRLVWRGFELNPGTPLEGSLLQTAANSDLRPGMWESVRDFGKKSGLNLSEPTHVPNTRLVHSWLRSIPDSDAKNSLIERIYQAYLSDKMSIGEVQVLAEIARELHLPETPLRCSQNNPSDTEPVRKIALAHGFAGMPGFLYKGKKHFGALSEEAWNNIIEAKTP